jgi:hypothetical protein
MTLRFFNIDLHVSVIEDIKMIWRDIFPEVVIDDWSISGHSRLFQHFREHNNEVICQENWRYFDEIMISKFHLLYDTMLSKYDGFIVTHTPIFVMLFEKYNKPIFVINSCRYNQPFCWNKNRYMMDKFHNCLERLDSKNLLTMIHNNKADEWFFRKNVTLKHLQYNIPSLCSYIEWKCPEKNVGGDDPRSSLCLYENVLIDDPYHIIGNIPNSVFKPSSYTYQEIYKYKAVIVIPRELSYMTFTEYIYAGIPIILPSKSLIKKWIQQDTIRLGTLLHYNLSTTEDIMEWLEYADYYQEDMQSVLRYFDSLTHLNEILNDKNTFDNKRNLELSFTRKNIIYRRWRYIWHYRFRFLITKDFWTTHFGVVVSIPSGQDKYTIVFMEPPSKDILETCVCDDRCVFILMVGHVDLDYLQANQKVQIIPIGFRNDYPTSFYECIWMSGSFTKTIDLFDKYNFKMPRKHSFKTTVHFSGFGDNEEYLKKSRFAIVLKDKDIVDSHFFYECLLYRCIPVFVTDKEYLGYVRFPCIQMITNNDWSQKLFNKYYDSVDWENVHKLLMRDSYIF